MKANLSKVIKQKLKVSIYSGEIPSTTFIERLINALAEEEITVYLFGRCRKTMNYNGEVKIISYRDNKLAKALHYLRYAMLLSVFKSGKKKRLIKLLKREGRYSLINKLKFYRVLWNHQNIFQTAIEFTQILFKIIKSHISI